MKNTVRIRSVSTFVLLLAFLCLNKTLCGQIVSDAEVPFIEETYPEEVTNVPVSEPEPDIEYVPASTIRELNLPSPRFRVQPRCYSETFRNVSSNNKSSLVAPPVMVENVIIPSSSNTIMTDEYLYHVASSHPWGRFPEGAWKRFRVVRETISYDTKNRPKMSQSSAEYTVTLRELLPDQFGLTWETALSGAGRRWNATPKKTEANYWEENVSLTLIDFKTKQDLTLNIEGVSYPCFREDVVFENEQKRVEIKTWRSTAEARTPQILRQERKIYTKQAGKNDQLSVSSVYQLSPTAIPYSLMGRLHQVWKTEQTDEMPQGKSVTTSIISLTVPGEIVSFETRLYNKNGDLINQMTGSTLDYGVRCSDARVEQPIKTFINNIRSRRRPNLP